MLPSSHRQIENKRPGEGAGSAASLPGPGCPRKISFSLVARRRRRESYCNSPAASLQGLCVLAKSGSAEGRSPLPEREVSSHNPFFSFSKPPQAASLENA